LKPKKFSDLICDLKLNPASLKFHSKVLTDCDLIRKRERGIYETTVLGKMILKLIEQAEKVSTK
jgi:predicted transcriptional regulator